MAINATAKIRKRNRRQTLDRVWQDRKTLKPAITDAGGGAGRIGTRKPNGNREAF